MKVSYSFLNGQFKDPDPILKDIKKLVLSGDFTLGEPLTEFETEFAKFSKRKYAIGVGTGTDALRLSLIALGIKPGDEVITAANTFYSTAAAIATIGAKPVFVDVNNRAVIDPELIEAAITDKTKAIIPVHLHGCAADMERIMPIAQKHNLLVVEDACQAIGAELSGKRVGTFGETGCYSLHPLKNINVWGDGGLVVTDSEEIRDELSILRDNGLRNRDECKVFAYNCRLDTLHAIVGLHVIKTVDWILKMRRENGEFYDEELSKIKQVKIPPRDPRVRYVHHNYVFFAEERDALIKFLQDNDISAKVHYPIPLHLQEASKYLGYKEGDFPVSEQQAKSIVSIPVHQHVTKSQREFVIAKIKEFHNEKG